MATPSVAANAYASLSRIIDSATGAGGAGKTAEAGGPSFSSLVKDAMNSVLDAGRKSAGL